MSGWARLRVTPVSAAVASLADDDCRECAGPLVKHRVEQPALIRHAGYGATRITITVGCPACGWWHRRDITEARPSRV